VEWVKVYKSVRVVSTGRRTRKSRKVLSQRVSGGGTEKTRFEGETMRSEVREWGILDRNVAGHDFAGRPVGDNATKVI
jgi:hypothetical protein